VVGGGGQGLTTNPVIILACGGTEKFENRCCNRRLVV